MLPLFLFLQHVFAKEEQKYAYITFDDGPTLNTPEIVETLEKYDARATFFVLEERIVRYPDFIKKIYHAKNAIGLHGVSHSEAIYYTPDSPLEEMEKANKALESVLGKGSRLVRVPFGSSYRLTKNQAEILESHGYKIWDWNVDPRDSVGQIVPERVIKAFDITEDTIFLVEYKDGELSVEPINDYDEEDYTDYFNDSSEEDELYGDS